MTDFRLTQAAIEEWGRIIPPQAQVTQAAVEEWATVATVVGTNYSLPAAQGSYALSGAAHSLYGMGLYGAGLYSAAIWGVELGVGMPAAQGSYALAGQAATLVHSAVTSFPAAAGSYALTGQAATLTATIAVHYSLGGAPGSYALAGQAAALVKLAHGQYAITTAQGAYALRGGTVTMSYTPAALVGKAQKPYLREGTYRVRQLGWAFDPTFVLRKNRPGPIRIVEFDGWMSG